MVEGDALQVVQERLHAVPAREIEGEGVALGPETDMSLRDVSIFDLISAFNDALSRVKEEQLSEIFADRFTVAEKIDSLVGLLNTADRIVLTNLFKGMVSKQEIICTFLAMLELMRLCRIRVQQEGHFGQIIVVKAEE